MNTYLVVWTKEALGGHDFWEAFDTLKEARERYDQIIETGAYVVTICAVVESTDFDTHPQLESLPAEETT